MDLYLATTDARAEELARLLPGDRASTFERLANALLPNFAGPAARRVLLDSAARKRPKGPFAGQVDSKSFLARFDTMLDEFSWNQSKVKPARGRQTALAGLEHDYAELLDKYGLADVRIVDWAKADCRWELLTNFSKIVVEESGRWAALIGSLESRFSVERLAPRGLREPKTETYELLEAPGRVGEMRMIARRIHELKIDPNRVVLTSREPRQSVRLMEEVFREYGVPLEHDFPPRFDELPVVRAFFFILGIPDNGWTFRDLGALLRSNFFDPDWPERGSDPNFLRRVEDLLRFLGEPKGKKAFLDGLATWTAEQVPLALEDEDMDEKRRLQMHQTALRSRPFLHRLFDAFDATKGKETFAEHLRRTRWLLEESGFARTIARTGNFLLKTQSAAFEAALDAVPPSPAKIDREKFLHLLRVVASGEYRPAKATRAGVRLLSPRDAARVDCDVLILFDLKEGSFPNLAGPNSLLDDDDRKKLGLGDPDKRMDEEQALFDSLLARADKRTILSRPAVDEKGEPLLPGSFLKAFVAKHPGLPVTHQRMPLDGYFERVPFSKAEYRVLGGPGKDDASQTVRQAARLADARFRTPVHTAADGIASGAVSLPVIQKKFDPAKLVSPTALESYVACPFQFLMKHVLRLRPLEDPTEEIEVYRKGMAFHRAMSRFHGEVKSPVPDLRDRFNEQLHAAMREYADRAASPFTKRLWELEGRRMERQTKDYSENWNELVTGWRKHAVTPEPKFLESDFGYKQRGAMELESASGKIRLGGRIDRVDAADIVDEVGFWIFDYKTGTPSGYTIRQFERMERLQLTLYARAVEKLYFPDRAARPLGLGYWFAAHKDGLKTFYPSKDPAKALRTRDDWQDYASRLEQWVGEIVTRIRGGMFPLVPRHDSSCDKCDYAEVCRINQGRGEKKDWELEPPC